MSDLPPDARTPSEQSTNRRRIWATAGLTLGAIAALGAAGGAWWAWVFVNEQLSPWVSEFLTESLNRPVALGEVEGVSPTGIRFGPSAIPPTATDPDEVYIESIDVRFNPLQLFRRQINPRIVLDGVRASLEQNAEGAWLETEIDLPEDDGEDPLIQINPAIQVQESELILVPFAGEGETPVPLVVENIDGSIAAEEVEIEDPRTPENTVKANEIAIDLTADPQDAGRVVVNGIVQQLNTREGAEQPDTLDTLDANLAIQLQELELAALAPVALAALPQEVPATVNGGQLNGSVDIDLTPGETPKITGTARLSDGEVTVDPLPKTINNISAQARFQGDRVALEDVTAEYATLTARAGGLIDLQRGYDLTAEVAPFELAAVAEELALDLPVSATGTFRAEAAVTGPLSEPEVTAELLSTGLTTLDRVQLSRVAAELVYTPAALTLSSLEVLPLAGGQLTGSGIYSLADPANLSVQLEGRDLPADAIGRAYGLPETVTLGAVALDAEVSGPLDDLSGLVNWQAPGGSFPTRGTAEIVANTVRLREAVVDVAGGTVSGTGTLAQGQWTADVVAQGIQLGEFEDSLQGAIAAGDFNLAGNLDDLSLQGVQADGDVAVSLRGGTLNSQVDLANGRWQADVRTRNFPAGQFVPQIPLGGVTADVALSGTVDDLTLNGIQADGTVTAALADGTVTSDIGLTNGTWRATGSGSGLQLGQLSPELQGTGRATFQLAGRLDNLSPTAIRGRTNVELSDGLATATRFAPQLAEVRSPLSATLDWDGRRLQVERLETAGLSAQGVVVPRLTGPDAPTIAAVDLDLSARDYALSALPVSLPPLLALEGQATFDGNLTGTPDNLSLTGEMALANLALNDLVFDSLLAGEVAFSSLEGLDVELLGQGDLSVPRDRIAVEYQLAARELDFELRAGETTATGETEGDLLLAKVRDFPVSALNLPPAERSPYGPLRGNVSFASASVNLQTLQTTGQANVEDLGIGYLSIDRVFTGFEYANDVASLNNGEIRIGDKDNRGESIPGTDRVYAFSGRYGFNQVPEIQASLTTQQGRLQDILGILKIQDLADLRRGLAPEAGFIPASQAEAEQVLATRPVGDPNGTLLNQLRRLAEILELQFQAERQTETATLPPLDELVGNFRGQVDVSATLPEDIAVAFNLEGQSWQWGPEFSADRVLARGNYQNGLISLAPVRFETDLETEVATVDLTGSFSIDPSDRQQRQLNLAVVNLPADKIPLDRVPGLSNIPFDLEGRLNGTAALAGVLTNPRLESSFRVVDGSLNGTAIDEFSTELNYRQARFSLDTEFRLANADDPLMVSAEIPYQLPFVEQPPADNSFFIEADVQDEGFALLNLFTQEVLTWQSGQGTARLRINGELDGAAIISLDTFDGVIQLENATVTSDALRDFENDRTPVTDVAGTIRLSREGTDLRTYTIVVDELTGRFSEGQIAARGSFPIFVPLDQTFDSVPEENTATTVPDAEDADGDAIAQNAEDAPVAPAAPAPARPITQIPLALALDDISLSLRGLYGGGVNGDVVVAGSVLQGPKLSGEIDLTNGTVLIPEAGAGGSTPTRQEEGIPVRFSDLRLRLLDDIRIVQGRLLDVEGRGILSINGTLRDIRPTGRILLPSGRVGLFAVALRLTGENDRAEFRSSLDPLLDVTLETSLPDTNSGPRLQPTTSPFPPNEIPDTTIEDIGLTQQGNRLVSIQARYTGLASELGDLLTDRSNLALTSSPTRSESEIVALLSGNVLGTIDALGGGNALGGFASFAGSAILGTIRNFIGDTGPISDFRIFQVSGSSGDSGESEDFGAEIGFDVRPNISVSVLKVLTDNSPFQYNVRYRLSNQFNLRGTTSFEDFQDRTGVLLEYETRF